MSQSKLIFNFMLIGKTASGKSSTGNTMLDGYFFEQSNSFKSCTKVPVKNSKEFIQYIFNVVDTPGVCDTQMTPEEILRNFAEEMCLIPEGLNALLFVVKLGDRLTDELIKAIKTIACIKASFGNSDFQRVCIIAFTNGEYAAECNLNNDNIEGWLRNPDNVEPGSSLEKLLQDCEYRFVLFYNKTSDKREDSVNKVLQYVHPQAPRYTNEHFKKCSAARDAYIISLGLPGSAETQTRLGLLRSAIMDSRKDNFRNVDDMISKLDAVMENLKAESKGSEILKKTIADVDKMKHTVVNLPSDEKGRLAAMYKIDIAATKLKSSGIVSGVLSVGASVGALVCVGAMTLSSGVGVGIALGVVALGAAVYAYHALKPKPLNKIKRNKNKQKLIWKC